MLGYVSQSAMRSDVRTIDALLENLRAKLVDAPAMIFVDQDETLVSTRIGSPWRDDNHDKSVVIETNVQSRLRPDAAEFLRNLRKIAPICILTAGQGAFQRRVLKAHGLLGLVGEVYGREDYQRVPKNKQHVLVDDTDPHSVAGEKLLALGCTHARLVQVTPWQGSDFADAELAKAYTKVRSLF